MFSSQDDVPDSPDDIDGDQPNHMTCAMYMGGVGTGTSWFGESCVSVVVVCLGPRWTRPFLGNKGNKHWRAEKG